MWSNSGPDSLPHPQSVQGTGLAFIAFTEAMTHFPASPFWSVMFFLMLINLGLGSMIGTMAGITTPIIDTFKVPKEMFTGNSLSPCQTPAQHVHGNLGSDVTGSSSTLCAEGPSLSPQTWMCHSASNTDRRCIYHLPASLGHRDGVEHLPPLK